MAPAADQVERLLQRMSRHGLQRSTAATVREIRAVAQTAHHARLIRLERELEGMATQLQRYLARDPSFRPSSFVGTANRIWLLVGQTRRRLLQASSVADMEQVAGVPRRKYEPMDGVLDVVCVAAAGWVTDSGFVGVTAHLYEADRDRFVQASMVRPERMVGPDPVRLLRFPVTDVSAMTMQELCHGAWSLDAVRESSDGRLSLHSDLVVMPGPEPGRAALDALKVSSAHELLDRLEARALDPVTGIGRELVLVEPVAFGPVRMNETHARARCQVRDRDGSVMHVSVSIRAQNDILIDNLERMRGAWAPDGLIAEAHVSDRAIWLRPLSAVYAEPVTLSRRISSTHLVHLTIEPLERASR